jgi:hypothetical protein
MRAKLPSAPTEQEWDAFFHVMDELMTMAVTTPLAVMERVIREEAEKRSSDLEGFVALAGETPN